MNGFADLSPVVQAPIATLGTWALTAAGATRVVFTRKVSLGFEHFFCRACTSIGILIRMMEHCLILTESTVCRRSRPPRDSLKTRAFH